ncbi:protein kinase [Cryptococcus neoformans A2-102-5]|nr:protein kinase [Cryptococcus neoformans var. grubii D17-1]OXG90925.1 protein kinase [Cryptococcus neoformans var. grubii A2-102-5]
MRMIGGLIGARKRIMKVQQKRKMTRSCWKQMTRKMAITRKSETTYRRSSKGPTMLPMLIRIDQISHQSTIPISSKSAKQREIKKPRTK